MKSRRAHRASIIAACAVALSPMAEAAIFDYRDTLDAAVSPPDNTDVEQVNRFDPFLADGITYDSNLYRVPSGVDDLGVLPGISSNAHRSDYSNAASVGLSAQWLIGQRQSIDLDMRVDDNRYKYSDDLNYVSTNDKLVWNWGLGGVLSGEVGADYAKFLGGFVNTAVYSRDIITKTEYFGAARYDLGPRWSLFGGILDTRFSYDNTATSYNNSQSKSFDIGASYATGAANRIGADYRYTDSRAPNDVDLNGIVFNPDYREDRLRALLTYVLTEKTLLDVSLGYLRRDFPTAAIGSFSGEIGRLSFQWQPTAKTQLLVSAWRELTADLTASTDYYASKGASVGPVWTPTEKVTVNFLVARENHVYVGSNPGAPIGIARRDNVTSETGTVQYSPILPLSINFSVGYERRDSNISEFQYNDVRGTVGATFKF